MSKHPSYGKNGLADPIFQVSSRSVFPGWGALDRRADRRAGRRADPMGAASRASLMGSGPVAF